MLEQFRFWIKDRPWDAGFFRSNNLSVISFSAKATESVNENSKTSFGKSNPLRLPCGIVVEKGYTGLTSQSRVVSLINVRVDGVKELNQALADASNEYDVSTWEIKNLDIHNTSLGPILHFSVFNPDGTGTGLYLECVETVDSKRLYFDVPAFEQQKLCANIQDKIANCVLVSRLVPQCGISEYYKEKAKANSKAKKSVVAG